MDRLAALEGTPAAKGVVVVTGGSAGLGRATVRAFAGAGYDVAVLARGEDGLAGAVADVAAAGGAGSACRATWPTMPPWKRPPSRSSPGSARSRCG